MKKSLYFLFYIVFQISSIAQVSTTWVQISSGARCNLGIKTDGKLWAWGYQRFGFGNGSLDYFPTPVQLGQGHSWIWVSAGSEHSFAIRSDSTLWAWGYNHNGQLGVGDTTDRTYMTQVGTEHSWKIVSAGISNSIGLKNNGTIWTWGIQRVPTHENHVPVQVQSENDWEYVLVSSVNFALKKDKSLWSWGNKGYGILGHDDRDTAKYPVKIKSDQPWKAFASGNEHALGIKADGTLWAWGKNVDAELGDSTKINRFRPIKIGKDTNWIAISGGFTHSLAIKSDGSLWAWGNNTYSQLGDGKTGTRIIPHRVGESNLWSMVSAGDLYSVAVKKSKDLYCMTGYDTRNMFGDNARADKNVFTCTTNKENITSVNTSLNDLENFVYTVSFDDGFTIKGKESSIFMLRNQLGESIKSIMLDHYNEFSETVSGLPQGIYLITNDFAINKASIKICICK